MGVLHPLPVVLPAATIAFAAADPAGTVRNATRGIQNTEPVGVLIDKIEVSSLGSRIPTAVLLQLRWRSETITNGFTSLAGVAWPQNRSNEIFVATIVLTKPIWLPPGEFLDVSIRNDLFAAGSAISIDVVAIGRQSAEPAERWLPYFTSYLGPVYGSGVAISDQSAPPDIGNPFDVTLHVERMIGRVLKSETGVLFTDSEPDITWPPYLVRLSDHRDRSWVQTPTPLPLVFNSVDRSWLLNHEMEAKGFLRLEFEGLTNSPGAVSRAVVGLVGYRRIS